HRLIRKETVAAESCACVTVKQVEIVGHESALMLELDPLWTPDHDAPPSREIENPFTPEKHIESVTHCSDCVSSPPMTSGSVCHVAPPSCVEMKPVAVTPG